jgi:histidine phosphotransferase ChpT
MPSEFRHQEDPGAVDDNLACVLEIHRDPIADHRLHLPQPPLGLAGVPYEAARLEKFVHGRPAPHGRGAMTAPDLGALVSARLCHDLVSPMGAIGNGLELMQLSGSAGEPEMQLVSDSLATALAKLRFFRVAFGPADPATHLQIEEAAELTAAMYTGRFTIAWGQVSGSLPRPVARMAFLAILCLEKSLPMGGLVRVSTAEDAIALSVDGRRTTALPDLWEHVTGGSPLAACRPENVQFPLLRQALVATGYAIDAAFSETAATVCLSVSYPSLADAQRS